MKKPEIKRFEVNGGYIESYQWRKSQEISFDCFGGGSHTHMNLSLEQARTLANYLGEACDFIEARK